VAVAEVDAEVVVETITPFSQAAAGMAKRFTGAQAGTVAFVAYKAMMRVPVEQKRAAPPPNLEFFH